jgi:hypothetical protein
MLNCAYIVSKIENAVTNKNSDFPPCLRRRQGATVRFGETVPGRIAVSEHIHGDSSIGLDRPVIKTISTI